MKEKDNVYLRPSVARVHLSTGDVRLCKSAWGVCVLAIISVWEKWMETTILSPLWVPSLVACGQRRPFTIPHYSNKYADILCPSNPLLDIYSKHSPQVWRGRVLGRPLWVYGCCQRSGGNKVFIPVGVDVQYDSSPPLGWGMGTQHLAVVDQIYYSWPHRCILKTQFWV